MDKSDNKNRNELEKAQNIVIPSDAKRDRSGYVRFNLKTQLGDLEIEAGRCNSLFIRGTPEAIIGYGLVRNEWLPGQPTTNATTQRIVFEQSGPLLPKGKPKGKRPTAPRIIIRAWGAHRRTVDVQVPITDEQMMQCNQIASRDKQAIAGYRDDASVAVAVAREYRKVGNVIYLC